jgi:hypothetical protein
MADDPGAKDSPAEGRQPNSPLGTGLQTTSPTEAEQGDAPSLMEPQGLGPVDAPSRIVRLRVWLRDLRARFLDSPRSKTLAFAISTVASGVLASAFVVEIALPGGGLVWANFYKCTSFYGLVVLLSIDYVLHRSVYIYETEIRRFLDADYCTAYMRSKCLPEAAERYRQLIREGKGGELKQAMDEIKKILK